MMIAILRNEAAPWEDTRCTILRHYCKYLLSFFVRWIVRSFSQCHKFELQKCLDLFEMGFLLSCHWMNYRFLIIIYCESLFFHMELVESRIKSEVKLSHSSNKSCTFFEMSLCCKVIYNNIQINRNRQCNFVILGQYTTLKGAKTRFKRVRSEHAWPCVLAPGVGKLLRSPDWSMRPSAEADAEVRAGTLNHVAATKKYKINRTISI